MSRPATIRPRYHHALRSLALIGAILRGSPAEAGGERQVHLFVGAAPNEPSRDKAPLSFVGHDVFAAIARDARIAAIITPAPQDRRWLELDRVDNACIAATHGGAPPGAPVRWLPMLARLERVIYVRGDARERYATLADLKGRPVGAIGGGPLGALLTEAGLALQPAFDDDLNKRKLIDGRIEGWATARVSAAGEAELARLGVVPGPDLPPYDMGIACSIHIDPTLFDDLRTSQAVLVESGAMAAILGALRPSFHRLPGAETARPD